MTTPPRPTRDDYEAALRGIHARRRRAHDDHPLALSDDPREVLTYLRRRGHNGLLADETGDDITDALTLRLWLWWEGEAFELWLLQAAEQLGRNRRTVGAVLGLTHGQSLIDRIRRLLARLGRQQVTAAAPAPTGRDDQIREVAAALVARRSEMPDDIAEDLCLDQLADAVPTWPPGSPPPTAGILLALRFALGDLDEALAPDADLRAVVAQGISLVGSRTSANTAWDVT